MKQKLYYFAYITGAQCVCAIPLYWVTGPGTIVGFSSMIAYIVSCLLGHMLILDQFISNSVGRTLLVIFAAISFLIGCIVLLFGVILIIAIKVGWLVFPVLLAYVLYFVWTAIVLPQKIRVTMEQSGVFS